MSLALAKRILAPANGTRALARLNRRTNWLNTRTGRKNRALASIPPHTGACPLVLAGTERGLWVARRARSRGATADSSPRREPWVKRTNESSPGWGERDLRRVVFCRPCRGLNGFGYDTHGFTVGYYLPRLRRWEDHFPMLVRKSFSRRAKARSKAS